LNLQAPVPASIINASPNIPDITPNVSTIKTEDLNMILDRFASTLIKALQPQQSVAQPAQPAQVRRQERTTQHCNFCGETDHFIGSCRHVVSYIAEGKVRRDAFGKVILSTGAFCPNNIPGEWLRDRVDEWHKRNPNQKAVVELERNSQQLMYGIQSEGTATFHLSADERIAALEQEIYTLRNKQLFDGVEVPRRKVGPPARKNAQPVPDALPERAQTPEPPAIPATKSTKSDKPSTTQAPADAAPDTDTQKKDDPKKTEIPLHPFRDVREPVYAPPHERNFAAPLPRLAKDKDSAYRSLAPIQSPKIAEEVYKRSMNTPCITLSQQELLSISPEVRQHVREAVTPKRLVPTGTRETKKVFIEEIPDEDDPLPFADEDDDETTAFVIPDPYETYLNALQPGQIPEQLIVAKDSHALRSIHMLVKSSEYVESIVDPGSQIIAMSEAVCHDLHLAYDPNIKLKMQSANGEVDESLGLARNVPCRIANITLFLQIHVIRSPAYDILLGRPFDVLTESIVKNFANEDQTITIRDPNTNRSATIPTIERGRPRHRLHAPCTDFRMTRD
jgi:hypothetical protein